MSAVCKREIEAALERFRRETRQLGFWSAPTFPLLELEAALERFRCETRGLAFKAEDITKRDRVAALAASILKPPGRRRVHSDEQRLLAAGYYVAERRRGVPEFKAYAVVREKLRLTCGDENIKTLVLEGKRLATNLRLARTRDTRAALKHTLATLEQVRRVMAR